MQMFYVVIFFSGATMASGHYIAYVKAADNLDDYIDCIKDTSKTSLSASSSEKSLNILKFLKPKALSSSLIESKNGLSSKGAMNGVRFCKSVDCCSIRLNKNIVENVINSFPRKNNSDYWPSSSTSHFSEDMWLECDDENVRPITTQEFREELAYKPNSTSTPYLLFYTKMTNVDSD